MTTKKIRVEVEAPGADTAADKIDGVAASVGSLDTKQKQASDSSESLSQKQAAASLRAIEFGTKLAAAASAVQGLATALGAEGAAVGLIGKLAQSTAAGAQMGAMFGPQGALTGAIIGAAIPALASLTTQTNAAAEAAEQHLAALREVRAEMAAQNEGAIAAQISGGVRSRDGGLTPERIEEERRVRLAELETLETRLARFHEQGAAAAADRIRQQLRNLDRFRTEIIRDQLEANAAPAGDSTDRARGIGAAEGATRAAGVANPAHARRAGRDTGAQWLAGWAESMRAGEEAAWMAEWSEQMRVGDEQHTLAIQAKNDQIQREIDLREKLAGLQAANDADWIAGWESQMEAGERSMEQRREQTELERANAAIAVQGIESVANGIGRAIAKVAETNATAEEGAKIALAATLEVIGQTAQMLAGMEFAKAIAAYPDVAGMALHAAAGIAFTAVAIGTGEGAGALNRDVAASQAARAEKPEKPESGGGAGAKSGGDTIIHFNQPIVTAQANAEFGRRIENMIEVGRRRAA